LAITFTRPLACGNGEGGIVVEPGGIVISMSLPDAIDEDDD